MLTLDDKRNAFKVYSIEKGKRRYYSFRISPVAAAGRYATARPALEHYSPPILACNEPNPMPRVLQLDYSSTADLLP